MSAFLCDHLSFYSPLVGKQTIEEKVVKNNQPWYKSTINSNQKPACVASSSNTVSSNQNVSAYQRPTSSSPNIDTSLKSSTDAPGGSKDFQMSSSYDGFPSEEMKSVEEEPPTEPPPEPVDNIPPSPFTLRASNCKKYQRPSRSNKTSHDAAENSSSSKPTETVSAQDKPNSALSASASSTAASAKPAAKPTGRGGGRVRDYTVLHPSCLSVCNVTIQDSIERSADELITTAAPADLGEAGQMKKKSDAPPPKTTRYVCLNSPCCEY